VQAWDSLDDGIVVRGRHLQLVVTAGVAVVMLGGSGLVRAPVGGRPASGGSGALPVSAQGVLSRVLGGGERSYWAEREGVGFVLFDRAQRLRARIGLGGVSVSSGGGRLGLTLRGYGYGSALRGVVAPAPRAVANRVVLRRGRLVEWYANGPLGLEQGFTLGRAPAAARTGPLTLELEVSGNLHVGLNGAAARFSGAGVSLGYRGLLATDAGGRSLPAWLESRPGRLLVRVDDAGARYPLTVDPLIQPQSAKLTASDGSSFDKLGYSVAISGETIVAGAPDIVLRSSNAGAVYVFVRHANVWASATQTAKLTASDGQKGDEIGSSVAISGDTIVAGAPGSTPTNHGAAYVFVKPPGGWTNATQTAKLTASDGAGSDELGHSVAISGDTVVAGTAHEGVYAFTKPAGGWTDRTQTAKLTASRVGSHEQPGWSVAISGETVAAGDPTENAVYAFVRPASGWANGTQTAKLTGSDRPELGLSVATTGDTIVAGAPYAMVGRNGDQGAAYVYVRPAGGWADGTQTARLTASDGAQLDHLGWSVAASGSTIVAGALQASGGKGAVYTFAKPPGGWTSGVEAAKLTASDAVRDDAFGGSVAVASVAVVAGAHLATVGSNAGQGAAYVFGRDLTVSDVSIGRRDGVVSFDARVLEPGRLDVLETAPAGVAASGASLLRPAPGRFAFARLHATAARAGKLELRVVPDARGRRLLHHHRRPVITSLQITFTPRDGQPQTVALGGLRLTGSRQR
jgi:hypothetical protein